MICGLKMLDINGYNSFEIYQNQFNDNNVQDNSTPDFNTDNHNQKQDSSSYLSQNVKKLTDDLTDVLTSRSNLFRSNSIQKGVALDDEQSRAIEQIKVPKNQSFLSNICTKITHIAISLVR